ncbi:DUF4038 domain-containing protein [Aurantimonas sp. A2-1-M11]|uniref:apiosidase-like domain-containing protein n=1 Tax=Aurantimonas sp. A2-1-M11 TaxID=3113712 RepID=UPI002F954D40
MSLAALTVGAVAAGGCTSSVESPKFPLSVTSGKRYLEDADGRPFFMHGDTAWSLIAQLTREEADLYLRDRNARGFNTILVNLLEHRFADNAPANIFGDLPFAKDGDYGSPNERYFKHADWILARACELGFLVLMTPSYAGNDGGPEGWYQEMKESGPASLRAYGRFLATRYRDLDNILWVHGGDYDPPDKDLVRALVEGIRDVNPEALHTAHGSPGSAALDFWAGEPWIKLNNVYTYDEVFPDALAQYRRREAMPFILMESGYENEHGTDAHRVRVQSYQAILSGASGHLFGNNPIWHFDGPGIYPAPVSWQQGLDSPGARSMTVLHDLIASVKWWLLEPDQGRLLLDGWTIAGARTVAASATDGSFALVYLPIGREIILDLRRLSGPLVAARWLDPASGASTPVNGSPFQAGIVMLSPNANSGADRKDWMLELVSEAEVEPSQ